MNTEKITDRVRKLFAKAERTDSPHEAEAYLAKAYELLARHGIDEAIARAGAGTDESEIGKWVFTPAGSYKYDQIMLVGVIANALHCSVVKTPDNKRATIYGVRGHLGRVEMLGGFLVSFMLATAATAQPPMFESAVTYRKSVMAGFMARVQSRLKQAERDAQVDSGDARGAELVLVSDARRAERAMHEAHGRLGTAGATRRSRSGWAEGERAADSVDLGGGNRLAGRRAITG